jgi:hypothetical protein
VDFIVRVTPSDALTSWANARCEEPSVNRLTTARSVGTQDIEQLGGMPSIGSCGVEALIVEYSSRFD